MTKPQENSPAHVLLKTYVELQELLSLYAVGVSIQHERPQKGSSGGGRQKGTHSDPTASQAMMDSSARSVRSAVRQVDLNVESLHDKVMALKRQLETAIDRWDA